MEIQDDDFGMQPLERRHALLAGPLARHLVAEALEVVPHGAEHVGVVIDEQQGLSHGAIPPSPAACSPDPRGSARPGGAAASRTACRPTARRRAASAAAGRPAPPPAPCGRARTTTALSPPPYAAGATTRGTRSEERR